MRKATCVGVLVVAVLFGLAAPPAGAITDGARWMAPPIPAWA